MTLSDLAKVTLAVGSGNTSNSCMAQDSWSITNDLGRTSANVTHCWLMRLRWNLKVRSCIGVIRTRDRADGVLQVARCGPLNALVDQYAQLVLDALRYAQPLEVGKERSDVVVTLRANCQACGSVDDGLQTVQVAAGQAGESDVAVVQF